MRIFKNESIFNQETQDWEEYYVIDNEYVSVDVYQEQVAVEELATEDEEIQEQEENYKLCECVFCVRQRELEMQEQESPYSCDGNCSECEASDQELEEDSCDCTECQGDNLTALALDCILQAGGCPECTIEILAQFREDMENIGWDSHREYIDEMNAE